MNVTQNQNKTLAKIQEMLDERDWTLYRLSKDSGITYSSLNSMFNKNTQPTISTLEKICTSFGITMADFFDEWTPSSKDILTDKEKKLVDSFRKLEKTDQDILEMLCQKLLLAKSNEKSNKEIHERDL